MAPISQAPLYKAIGDLGTATPRLLPCVVGDTKARATSFADSSLMPQPASPPPTLTMMSRGPAELPESNALDTTALPEGSILLNVYNNGEADPCEHLNVACTRNDTVVSGAAVHAGVEVYGSEWSYGFTEDEQTGVYPAVPRSSSKHTYRVTVNMGSTRLSACEVEASLHNLERRWRGRDYSHNHHGCLDFCNAFCNELGVGRIPGWVDHLGCTSSFDILSRCTADGIRSTTELARSVSNDFDFHVRNVGQNLAQEVEQAVAGARREVEVMSVSFVRWGQGLLGAAARALGDLEQGRRHGSIGGEALRNSLRNRGGIRLASRKALTESEKRGEAVDAFLLDDSSEPLDKFDNARKESCTTAGELSCGSESSSEVEPEDSWIFASVVEATTISAVDGRAGHLAEAAIVDEVDALISGDDMENAKESVEGRDICPRRAPAEPYVERSVGVSVHLAGPVSDSDVEVSDADVQVVGREVSDNEWTLL